MRQLAPAFVLLLSTLTSPPARAIDHADSASTMAAPTTDITDLFSWMSSDGSKVILAMTVFPSASAGSRFATDALYVFHTVSRPSLLATTGVQTDIYCGFDDSQRISCIVGDPSTSASGDASSPSGITSTNGKLKVFAGLRKDPSFVSVPNLVNFKTAVTSALVGVTADAAGCKALPVSAGKTSAQTALAGTSPSINTYAPNSVLSLVMEVDRTLLSRGGPILSVWGATHKKLKTN